MQGLRIRAITGGCSISGLSPSNLSSLSYMYQLLEEKFFNDGVEVQTKRLVLEAVRPDSCLEQVRLMGALDSIVDFVDKLAIRWLCLPIAGEDGWRHGDLRKCSVELIRRYRNLFIHYIMAEHGQIHASCAPIAAQAVLDISRMSNNGYDNFRVGIGANIAPNTPFFPFSLHENKRGFSLAVELLEPLMLEFTKNNALPLQQLEGLLVRLVTNICLYVDRIANDSAQELGDTFEYKGLDISIAPFPDETKSVAKLIEMISQVRFGCMGTLTATAFLTNILKKSLITSRVKTAGFNGVMFSQLEDAYLANVIRQTPDIRLEMFMLYSAVCGCGIDMIPIPGNTLQDELVHLFTDIATLSCRYNKPLGVRVLPIPTKRVNEITAFNHDFLVNSRILSIN